MPMMPQIRPLRRSGRTARFDVGTRQDDGDNAEDDAEKRKPAQDDGGDAADEGSCRLAVACRLRLPVRRHGLTHRRLAVGRHLTLRAVGRCDGRGSRIRVNRLRRLRRLRRRGSTRIRLLIWIGRGSRLRSRGLRGRVRVNRLRRIRRRLSRLRHRLRRLGDRLRRLGDRLHGLGGLRRLAGRHRLSGLRNLVDVFLIHGCSLRFHGQAVASSPVDADGANKKRSSRRFGSTQILAESTERHRVNTDETQSFFERRRTAAAPANHARQPHRRSLRGRRRSRDRGTSDRRSRGRSARAASRCTR